MRVWERGDDFAENAAVVMLDLGWRSMIKLLLEN